MTRSKIDLVINQSKCTLNLFKKTKKLGCQPTNTFIDANSKFGVKDKQKFKKMRM